MHFDFVDIGTCDFDTSIDSITDSTSKILLVEPLEQYLYQLPDHPTVIKDCIAIGNLPKEDEIYYLPDSVISKYNLPWYLKGCSSIGRNHPLLISVLKENNLDISLIQRKKVNIITFEMLCVRHNITSISNLKIDTEGHEQYILPDVLKKVKAGFEISLIKFENQGYLGNKPLLDRLLLDFLDVGYELIEQNVLDTTIQKLQN